jgi:hypothetical protein
MNMSFDLKTAIGSIAPALATMLGGPLAGTAVSALAQAFGLGPTATQDDITKVIQGGGMTPDIIAQVRAADQKHAEIMSQQGIDLAKLNADHEAALAQTDTEDRDSARKREEIVKDWTPSLLSFCITFGFFGILVFLMQYQPPTGSRDILNIMLGALGTAWISAISYYFGSSAGSNDKNKIILSQTK